MSNAKIGAPNWIEPAWSAFSMSAAGKWGAVSTLVNLADSDFGNPAVSTDVNPGYLRIDLSAIATVLGSNPGADCLMIPKHNLTQAATIRVKASNTAFAADGSNAGVVIYDSGVVAALPAIVYPAGLLAWGHINTWTGAPDPVMDLSAYNHCVLVQFGQTIVAKYWAIVIVDAANPDGHFSLARLFIGPFYQPLINFAYGAVQDFQGDRVADVTATNAEFIDGIRALKRVATLQLADMTVDEAVAIFTGLQMYLGYAKQGALIFDTSDTYHMQRRSYMFTIQKPGGIAYDYYNSSTVPLILQEVI